MDRRGARSEEVEEARITAEGRRMVREEEELAEWIGRVAKMELADIAARRQVRAGGGRESGIMVEWRARSDVLETKDERGRGFMMYWKLRTSEDEVRVKSARLKNDK